MSDLVHYEGGSRWDVLQAQAKALARTKFVPPAYQDKPDEIVAAGLYGEAIGLSVVTALSYIDVINGKPTLKPEGMLALVRSRGHAVSGSASDKVATVTGKRRDTGDELTVEWTIEMAANAKLIEKNPTWKSYPQSMLWARAVGQLCRMLFSDVLLGLSYTPEEMGDAEVLEARVVDRDTGEITAAPSTTAATTEGTGTLKKVVSAGPQGTETYYVDTAVPEDAPAQQRLLSEEDGERRTLIDSNKSAVKALDIQQRAAFDTFLAEHDIPPNRPAKDFTLEQLRLVAEYLGAQLEEPF